MHALEVEGELLPSERPTIPVPAPRESGVRLKVARVASFAATVDVVVCDLSRDPRSEDYVPRAARASGIAPRMSIAKAQPGPRLVPHAPHALRLAQPAPRLDELDDPGEPSRSQNERPPSTSIVRALK